MVTMNVAQRRARLIRRHHLAADHAAPSPLAVAESLVALHATDPATVYLSVLARCPTAGLADVSAALHEDRKLVRMLAMRRTLFAVPTALAPVVHGAASVEVARWLRRQLIKHLETVPTDPPVPRPAAAWLAAVEDGTTRALLERGEATAGDLAKDEPRLQTALLPTTDKKWDVRTNVTTRVIGLMAAEGRLVRGRPRGGWFSRQHRWAPVTAVWPDGLPELPEHEASVELVSRWLATFGPATFADVQWWTGWTVGKTRRVLASVDPVEVDLDGAPGLVLANDLDLEPPVAPAAALLPSLDPTPMGWKERDWFLGPHRDRLFDRNGNIGPTVWWDGRVVGGWAVRGTEVVWGLLEDVGVDATTAIEQAADDLQDRLGGTPVVPSFRTPLERELSA